MNNYFHPIGRFDIDSALLYNEWMTISNEYDLFNRTIISTPDNFTKEYYRLRINYLDSDVDPVMIDYIKSTKQYNIDTSTNFKIIKDFQGSYTEQISSTVSDFLQKRFPSYYITFIKYHSLGPKSRFSLHTDTGTDVPRFFLLVWTKPGCYMQILDDKINMSDEGALYKLNCRVLHNPINDSDDHRLCMVFDVKKR